METVEPQVVVTGSTVLSRFIVIQTVPHHDKGYAHYDSNGFVVLGAESVFSPLAKIEAEPATSNHRYVHLRFCHNNRYWAAGKDKFIVAESNKPEEDTTKSSCTLFEAISISSDKRRHFNLKHVQSGWNLLLETSTMRFMIDESPIPDHQVLRFVDWDTLVILPPRHVAFKGLHNGRYLQVVDFDYLQLAAEDPEQIESSFRVEHMPDGHVRIMPDGHEIRYWFRSQEGNSWIVASWTDSWPYLGNLFRPVKLDGNTIALRNEEVRLFLRGHDGDTRTNYLRAADRTITPEARLGVEELVSERQIYHVRYRVKDARIFNERRFVAGTTIALNYGDTTVGIPVQVGYEDSKSYSFSRSVSITTAVPTTIEAGVPFISIDDQIQMVNQISGALKWNETTTTTTSVKAAGAVPVPPSSMVQVNYVGTMGKCDVPFNYTQQDRNSVNGNLSETQHSDGVFRGVNAYNFSFVVTATQPI